MNDNHSNSEWIYRTRWLEPRLAEAVARHRVVVVTGARQVGKSTLLRHAEPVCNWRYQTLDDLDIQEQAQRDPEALWAGEAHVVIDEAQRVPEVFLAVKRTVDRDRRRRFVLSGSANLSLLEKVSESLAGRAVYLVLRPMALGECEGKEASDALEELLNGNLPSKQPDFIPPEPLSLALNGFMPGLLWLPSREAVLEWWQGYVSTYLERDLRALSQVSSLTDYRRVMDLAALRTGQLVNQTEIARDSGVSQPTVHRYLNLLEVSFLIHRLPAFAAGRTPRLVKSPKLYWADPALAAFLMGHYTAEVVKEEREAGALFENLVLLHLQALADLLTPQGRLYYWRTVSNKEVDFVLEQGRRLVALEVKLTTTPRYRDTESLRQFLKLYSRCRMGVLVYWGNEIVRLGDQIIAIPWHVLARKIEPMKR